MDVDTLEPGVDFVERIRSAVGSADALLVVIGRGWLNAESQNGERRLDDPGDFVRLEIGIALRGDPVVVPVLVGGATMPAEDELPPDLALLARRNAVTLADADWRSGLARLAKWRTAASGALIALGCFLSLLWAARYIGFPVWRLGDAGSIAPGGFIGAAGGLAILVGGLYAHARARAGRMRSVGRTQEVS